MGKITNLGQEFDPVTRLMQVRIEVRNPDTHLRPEMLASAEFIRGDRIPTVLVPQEALQQVNGEDVVFVRLASDRFRVQTVQIGENVLSPKNSPDLCTRTRDLKAKSITKGPSGLLLQTSALNLLGGISGILSARFTGRRPSDLWSAGRA